MFYLVSTAFYKFEAIFQNPVSLEKLEDLPILAQHSYDLITVRITQYPTVPILTDSFLSHFIHFLIQP